LEAKKAELESPIKATGPTKSEDGEGGEASDGAADETDEENAVDEAQLKS
jgi:type I restriction enzyme M protein